MFLIKQLDYFYLLLCFILLEICHGGKKYTMEIDLYQFKEILRDYVLESFLKQCYYYFLVLVYICITK